MSERDRVSELTERVESLEAVVRAHGESLRTIRGASFGAQPRSTTFQSAFASTPTQAAHRSREGGEAVESAPPTRRFEERIRGLESVLRADWLFTRGGILLLLLGVAFLFKLSVDEGWITPPIRVALGLGLGAALIGLGLRIYAGRTTVGQVLLGGGIASFYISGFAAFTLYSLVPAYVAFPFMVAVTITAFVLALRQNSPTLSIIGVAGGLATPFLLYTDDGSVVSLTFYTALVFAGAAAVYLYRGWRILLGVATSGALIALITGAASLSTPMDEFSADRMALVGGVVFVWIASWIAPILRSLQNGIDSRIRESLALVPTVMLPIAAFSLVRLFIEVGEPAPGYIWLGLAALYGLVWYVLRNAESFRDGTLVYAQAVAAMVLGTLGTVESLEGWSLTLALATEAAALVLLATRYRQMLAQIAGHVLFGVLWLRLAYDVVERFDSYLAQDQRAITWIVWLLVLAVALASSLLLRGPVSAAYKVLVHVGFLGWILAVLAPFENAGVWTTVAWGLCGVALIVAALRTDASLVFRIGLGTLLLVVGKLFLVDLFWVEALWRVALFVGFGGLFLGLGYAVQLIWRPGANGRTPGHES